MDFEQAFVQCIKTGNRDGIKALGIDKYTVNEVFVCDTPLDEKVLPLRRPTPLVYAIMCEQQAIACDLINLGADIHQKVLGWRPIHYAVLQSHHSVIGKICEMDSDEINATTDEQEATPLHIAASNGRTYGLGKLLCLGADVNKANTRGETALHMAAVGTCTKITAALLAFGADRTLKNDRGMTALDLAQQRKNLPMIKFFEMAESRPELLPSKESVLAENQRGRTVSAIDIDNSDEDLEEKNDDIIEHLQLLEQRLDALEEEISSK